MKERGVKFKLRQDRQSTLVTDLAILYDPDEPCLANPTRVHPEPEGNLGAAPQLDPGLQPATV